MAMITALDDAVGEIVQNLKSKGLFDDTFFLFTSDVSIICIKVSTFMSVRSGTPLLCGEI